MYEAANKLQTSATDNCTQGMEELHVQDFQKEISVDGLLEPIFVNLRDSNTQESESSA
jgi:hypothetical protein